MASKETFSMNKEGLYSTAVRIFRRDAPLVDVGELRSQRERDFLFAMQCNGYFLLKNGQWTHNSDTTKPFIEEFRGQRVSFFGPTLTDEFFSGQDFGHLRFVDVFGQQQVTDVIRKYREVDEDQAARIAFLLGGVVRHLPSKSPSEIAKAVKFAARMTMLGEQRSADAVASAMAMYIISGGSLDEDNHFTGTVYRMTEAIREDPVVPQETEDLGLSQAVRLHTFVDGVKPQAQALSEVTEHRKAFDNFPTVGAEFHFPLDSLSKFPNFLQRLAILNMSAYQKGSYVQLSRNDRGVIEIRMNPSIYPIAITNWNYIKLLLQELNQSFFALTINRKSVSENFSWDRDRYLLNNLRSLGLLTYAGLFKDMPQVEKPEEIDLGGVYLGQTVRIHNGEYIFSGNWSRGEGLGGQLSIYAGFGDTFPDLAYYLSMALANPNILGSTEGKFLSKVKNLNDALAVHSIERESFFKTIKSHVEKDNRLSEAHDAGNRIMELLNPLQINF